MKASLLLIVTGLALGGCCDEDFISPDYDFIEFAIDLTEEIDTGCPSTPEFTTIGATNAGSSSLCLDNPVKNRWFKFQAPYTGIYAQVSINSVGGSQRNSIISIWDTDGTTELACNSYYDPTDDVYTSYYALVVGDWYYVSVDVDDPGSAGTFAICLYTD